MYKWQNSENAKNPDIDQQNHINAVLKIRRIYYQQEKIKDPLNNTQSISGNLIFKYIIMYIILCPIYNSLNY